MQLKNAEIAEDRIPFSILFGILHSENVLLIFANGVKVYQTEHFNSGTSFFHLTHLNK